MSNTVDFCKRQVGVSPNIFGHEICKEIIFSLLIVFVRRSTMLRHPDYGRLEEMLNFNRIFFPGYDQNFFFSALHQNRLNTAKRENAQKYHKEFLSTNMVS